MQNLYAVRDVKADSFGSLICAPTKGLATRSFADACADPRSALALYAADYSLYELGTFDPASGGIVGHATPVYVCSAVEMIAELKRMRGDDKQLVIPGTEVAS